MKHSNCFASGLKGKCTATEHTDCKGCKFYKTNKQFREDFDNARLRLERIGLFDEMKKRYPLLRDMDGRI